MNTAQHHQNDRPARHERCAPPSLPEPDNAKPAATQVAPKSTPRNERSAPQPLGSERLEISPDKPAASPATNREEVKSKPAETSASVNPVQVAEPLETAPVVDQVRQENKWRSMLKAWRTRRMAEGNSRIYRPDESKRRKIVAWTSIIFCLLFLCCAVLSFFWKRPVLPVSFGIVPFLDAAFALLPGLYLLSVVYYIFLACCALAAFISVTTAHIEIPGNPASPLTLFSRRTVRFGFPQFMYSVCLFLGAITLYNSDYRLFAFIAAIIAVAYFLNGMVRIFIPIARPYIVVELSSDLGIGNRITIGAGAHGLINGTVVIFHERLISAQRDTTLWEFICGLSGISFNFFDAHNHPTMLPVRAVGTPASVTQLVHTLNGLFKASATAAAYDRRPVSASALRPNQNIPASTNVASKFGDPQRQLN